MNVCAGYILLVFSLLQPVPNGDSFTRSAQQVSQQVYSSYATCMAAKNSVERNMRATLVRAECKKQ